MTRAAGTWSPIYGQAWTHPKTRRAVAALLKADRRTRAEVAPFLVLGWLNRLCLWALANNEAGTVGGAPGRAAAGPPPPDGGDVLERMRAEVANGQPRGSA